jgi:hypothetical protein
MFDVIRGCVCSRGVRSGVAANVADQEPVEKASYGVMPTTTTLVDVTVPPADT